MNAPPAPHPTPDELKAFGLGELTGATADAVGRHLETCADCRQAVAAAPADHFLDQLRAAYSAGAVPPELAACPQYEDVRPIGEGGMGLVFVARNRLMGRPEVLKVVNQRLLTRPEAAGRFAQEIRSAARLDPHPNVVTAFSAVRLGELLVFCMEYVPGTDLGRLVDARGPLPVRDACDYARQAARGLQHAHEKKVVHRDVKPQNLMLHADGVVKVLDFGLAEGQP